MSDPLDSDVGPHDAADHTCIDCDIYADGGAECDTVSIAESFADRAREHALRGPAVTIHARTDLRYFADVADRIRRDLPGPDDDLRSTFTD